MEIDNQLDALTRALTNAIAQSTPFLNFLSQSRPGFTKECKEAQQRARRLKKEWKKNPTLETWEAFRSARNFKGTLIKKAMQNAFRKVVEEACINEKAMWKFSKWARNRTSSHQAAMPEIEGETVPSRKALRFQQAFFPDAPVTANDDLQNYTYKDVYKTPELIGENKIYSAIDQLSSGRAPGEDNIPSEILKATLEIIMPHIHRLFNLCYENSYCPSHFKKSITVVLRKPQKENYTKAKAYRPVALLNTLGKALEVIVAKRLNFLATTHTLLPKSHMGGRKGTSTDHACHHLIEAVYAAWNSKKVASLLLLDVSGAFDNVDQARLIHNLCKRQVDTKIV